MTISNKIFGKTLKIGKDIKIIEFNTCIIESSEVDFGDNFNEIQVGNSAQRTSSCSRKDNQNKRVKTDEVGFCLSRTIIFSKLLF